MKKPRTKEKIGIHPVMMLLILSFVTIILSGILNFFNVQSTFNKISSVTGDLQVTTEAVHSLFSLSGLKYIFTTTVSNFAEFAVLSNLIIILFGVGIMVKSGFLKTVVTLLTKKLKRTTVSFGIILICILASLIGDLSYVILIPLSALIFKYAKRNPMTGIVASFAALSCGSGISLFLTSVDSSLITITLSNASVISTNYSISPWGYILINAILIIIVSLVITNITEVYTVKRMPKYEFEEENDEEILDDVVLTKSKMRGLLFALGAGLIYLFIFIYNIIPGLPFSGKLLDYTQHLYIDKLFSYNSFFSNGFVFVVAVLFVILGLFYGIGAKTIKNNKEFIDSLGHSLNGIGKLLVMIFASATFINIFKQTNIGNVIAGAVCAFIENSEFAGLPLLIVLFFGSVIVSIFLPNPINSWQILSGCVPTFINLSVSPAYTQLVFRLGSSIGISLTPVFAYFVVYIAIFKKHNQESRAITLGTAIKYQLPYAIITMLIYLAVIVIWYIIGAPLGIGTGVAL